MWSTDNDSRPHGVVDLDPMGYGREELGARLSGGTFRVLGKITHVEQEGHSADLLQERVLSSATSLLNRLVEAQGETPGLDRYRRRTQEAREAIERFCPLRVPDLAVRVAATSVCI